MAIPGDYHRSNLFRIPPNPQSSPFIPHPLSIWYDLRFANYARKEKKEVITEQQGQRPVYSFMYALKSPEARMNIKASITFYTC